jgi:glutamyl/glutaminyl-tRNA synthetase
MSIDDLYEQGIEFLEQQIFYKEFLKSAELTAGEIKEYTKKILTVEQERLNKFTEIGIENPFFFRTSDKLKFTLADIRWKENSDKETETSLIKIQEVFENISDKEWTQEIIQEKLLGLAGEKRGDYLFPLRWVLSDQQKSPSPFEIAWALGKDESLKRIKSAIRKF